MGNAVGDVVGASGQELEERTTVRQPSCVLA
jgi:hypothetical protein